MLRACSLSLLLLLAACGEDPSGVTDTPIGADADGDAGPDARPDAAQDASDAGDAGDRDAAEDGGADAEPLDGDDPDAEPIDGAQTDAEPQDADPEDADPEDADPEDADPEDADPLDGQDPDAQDPDANDAGTPDTGVGIAALNDEFNDAATLVNWTFRDVAEGTPAQYSTADINTSTLGHLTIIPSQTSVWLNSSRGIYLYKQVTGDFIMRAYVRSVRLAAPTMPPTQQFNSTGVLARDPASAITSENWATILLGYQAAAVGTRDAETINGTTGTSSLRASFLWEGQVTLCRIGSNFYTYYITPAKGVWTMTNWLILNNMPQTVQAGVAVEAGGNQPHLRAEVDWIRFAVPTQESDCTMNIPPN